MIGLHQERPPCVAWPGRTRQLVDYGAGRICTDDDCGTILRRTHESDRCELHRSLSSGPGTCAHPNGRDSTQALRLRNYLMGRAFVPTAECAAHLGIPVHRVGRIVWELRDRHEVAIETARQGRVRGYVYVGNHTEEGA